MSADDSLRVEELLIESGRPAVRITSDTWRSRLRGKEVNLPFYVRLDPAGFVIFAVVPVVKSPEDADKASALYARLLDLNQSLLMAKFSIDDDLDVVLSVEYPTESLDPSEFRDAVDALVHYADRYYGELVALV